MAHKQKQCEAKHPIHDKQCWLRKHGPDERHMTVVSASDGQIKKEYWSAA